MARVLGILAVVGLILGGLIWLGSGARDEVRGLDASQLGLDGLVPALALRQIEVTRAGPGGTVTVEDIGLRILPVWDMDLSDDRPETVGDTTLRTIRAWQVQSKVWHAPTLIVLPKWRWATVTRSVAAPETAIPLADFPRLMTDLALQGTRVTRGSAAFAETFGWRLFLPQLFDARSLPETCATEVGDETRALVIRCEAEGVVSWVLSDPDALNNHGLGQGTNALQSAALLRWLQGEGILYLDPYPVDHTVWEDSGRVDYERDGDDLWRYFASPLGEIWGMLAILLALFLWRGGVRFGPLLRAEEAGPERSRREAVATRGRLIRLTGQDAAMAADYVRSDLIRMAEAAFGPGRGEVARLWPLLARRDGDRAADFQRLAQDLMRGLPATPAALRRQLDTYHQLQRSLTHGHDA